MELQDTLKQFVMQLKNEQRTFRKVAEVCKQIMTTLYDRYFPDAETRRPGTYQSLS